MSFTNHEDREPGPQEVAVSDLREQHRRACEHANRLAAQLTAERERREALEGTLRFIAERRDIGMPTPSFQAIARDALALSDSPHPDAGMKREWRAVALDTLTLEGDPPAKEQHGPWQAEQGRADKDAAVYELAYPEVWLEWRLVGEPQRVEEEK